VVDRFGRRLDCLRISVTDRCNLRCRYCMPAGRVPLVPAEKLLTFEEIVAVAEVAVRLGLTRLRLTGGEPLLRPGLPDLVRRLAAIPGVTDLALTTNGLLLRSQAAALAAAGLRRVNVSLDTLSPARYRWLTRGGDLSAVLDGLQAARESGLWPIKLNCVVEQSAEEPDAQAVAAFAAREGFEVRFIHRMDARRGIFSVVEGGSGGDCAHCSRLRLSCTGWVHPCLFSDLGFSVRERGPEQALREAVRHKPATGGPCRRNWIRAVGG